MTDLQNYEKQLEDFNKHEKSMKTFLMLMPKKIIVFLILSTLKCHIENKIKALKSK